MRPIYRLIRFIIDKDGAFGILLNEEGHFVCFTLEHTYEDLSVKIPPGLHRCTATIFHKRGYATFEIHVTGHSRLLFHRGNTERDSDGCILLGFSLGYLGGHRAVLESVKGFHRFIEEIGSVTSFDLRVENPQ